MELEYGVFFGDEQLNINETLVASLHSNLGKAWDFCRSVELELRGFKNIGNFSLKNKGMIVPEKKCIQSSVLLVTYFRLVLCQNKYTYAKVLLNT